MSSASRASATRTSGSRSCAPGSRCMPPDRRKYLWDALAAADLLAQFSEGRSFDDYQADALLRSAVERQFEIIGEASTSCPNWTRTLLPASPTSGGSSPSATS